MWSARSARTSQEVVRTGLTESSGHDDGDDGAQFHGEAPGRRHEGDAVAEVAHDVVAVRPEAEDDAGAAKGEDPKGHVGLVAGYLRGAPDLVDGGIGPDGVGHVVGAVRKGRGRGGHDLEERVEELGAVVKVAGPGMHLLDIAGEHRLFALGADNVLVDAAKHEPLGEPPDTGARVPGAVGLGADERLVRPGAGGGSGGLVGVEAPGRIGGAGRGLDLTLSLPLDVVGGDIPGAAGVELLAGQVALVKVADDPLEVGRGRRDGPASEQKGPLEDVPGAELPVLPDDDAVEPGDEEEGHEEAPGGAGGDDDAGDLSVAQVDGVVAALPDEQHDDERGRDPEVDGDEEEAPGRRVGAQQDAVFSDEEDDGAKGARHDGGNDPGEEDLSGHERKPRSEPPSGVRGAAGARPAGEWKRGRTCTTPCFMSTEPSGW
ncbi:hypothetical protein G6O67_007772 [Ophiocordyceps sinensis]|uniref:Uncharacterized protein n=1 Tax=Ophiocordyceps sinensis TaxID=72228 RepID=A0A8H4PLK1_9HYPO|nr:hypothetical protein G6O67_007772 [Ophiocordyceps sinensis]